MYKPFSLFVGLRYTRAKRRNHFISFISLISMLGIALGVMVLITVLSVMNGFDQELRERILGMIPHITITGYDSKLDEWQQLTTDLAKLPEVKTAAPFVEGQALMSFGARNHYVFLQGVYPDHQASAKLLAQKLVEGSLDELKAGDFNMILGERIAQSLGVGVGDKVTVVLPEAALTPAGIVPRLKRFTVVGIFAVGYEYDSTVAYANLQDLQKLYRLGDRVSGVQLQIDNLYAAPRIAQEIKANLSGEYFVYDWTVGSNKNFFEAVKLEKTVMFVMLLFIVAVAAFNILSALVMMVTDKQSDIAILRTLGASAGMIMRTFMVQGILIGIVGTFIGTIAGSILALNVTQLVSIIESYFHVQFLSADIYYISFLPSKLEYQDVVLICFISLIMSVTATLYPAWRAARTQPAQALRYD